jgi:hypothetical protein
MGRAIIAGLIGLAAGIALAAWAETMDGSEEPGEIDFFGTNGDDTEPDSENDAVTEY